MPVMPAAWQPARGAPADDLVQAVIRRWPDAVGVFTRRTACVGCAMAPYVTVRGAAVSYGIDAEAFARDLARAAKGHGGAPAQARRGNGTETGSSGRGE